MRLVLHVIVAATREFVNGANPAHRPSGAGMEVGDHFAALVGGLDSRITVVFFKISLSMRSTATSRRKRARFQP